ncbi:hypothetical protein LCGC14_2096500 [marine sediment metagenome]|uniref:Uncharacterized protein n=1 Tax=marine sediment metagenome TaxID=412755 RepID=A0A0F9EB85_9ZZZZ
MKTRTVTLVTKVIVFVRGENDFGQVEGGQV